MNPSDTPRTRCGLPSNDYERLLTFSLCPCLSARLGLSIYEDEPSGEAAAEAESDMPPLEDESATVMEEVD